jgi:hypothetical protein
MEKETVRKKTKEGRNIRVEKKDREVLRIILTAL